MAVQVRSALGGYSWFLEVTCGEKVVTLRIEGGPMVMGVTDRPIPATLKPVVRASPRDDPTLHDSAHETWQSFLLALFTEEIADDVICPQDHLEDTERILVGEVRAFLYGM